MGEPRIRSLVCLSLLLFAAPAGSARAAGPQLSTAKAAADLKGVRLGIHGRLRYRHFELSAFPLSDDGLTHGHSQSGHMLTRISARLSYDGRYYLHGQFQLFDGQFYGHSSYAGRDAVQIPWRNKRVVDQIAMREVYLHADVFIGALRVGRMQSHWGLGILANGGDREDSAFADASHGDVVNRLLFITKPLAAFTDAPWGDKLFLMLGADLVEHDELAVRADGDLAWQVVAAVAWRERAGELGLYFAYRDLERDSGHRTTAHAIDLYGRWEARLGGTLRLKVQAELAIISGSTEEARFDGARYPLDVLQHGGALRAELLRGDDGPSGSLDFGWATGDARPQDSTLTAFRFDPGFHIGMILFEEVLARVTARGVDRADDPDLVAVAPHGLKRLPTNGSISNAVYLYPQFAWQFFSQRLELRAAVLLAFAPDDVVDPYRSALYGGYNVNAFGTRDASGFLGFEVNLGLTFTQRKIADVLAFRLGAHYAVFLPGEALAAADGIEPIEDVHKLRILFDFLW